MAEIMKLLETNGAFQSDLMQTFLSSAQLVKDNSSTGGTLHSFTNSGINLNINASTVLSPNTQSSTAFSSLPETTTTTNINACVNKNLTYSGGNLNGNQGNMPSTQFVNENLVSPRILPVDNVNANIPSNLNELNKTNLIPPRPNDNINNNSLTNINIAAPVDATDSLNGNTNVGSTRQVTITTQNKLEPSGARNIPDTNANNALDIAQILSAVHEKASDSRQLLIDQVTSAIVDTHMSTTINTYANVAAANERIQKEKDEMPDMSSLSMNGSNLWQLFMGAMVPEITKVINFCTKLPGFPEVGQEDKICLIKQGCFEVMVARFCMLVDHVKEEMLDPTLKVKAPRSAVREMPMGPFLDQFFTVAGQFNPLCLTDGEISMFTAILMICPEREGLKNQAAVNILQQLFIQALYLLLKQSHQDADKTLTSLISLVPVFHKINEDHLKFLRMIKMKSPAEFEKKFPPLHKELFDTC